MDKATLISKLDFVNSQHVGLEMYFLCRKGHDEPTEILRANLEGTDTKGKLETVFIGKIKSQLLSIISENNKNSEEVLDWNLKHIRDVDDLKSNYYYFPNELSSKDDSVADYHIPEEFKEMVVLWNTAYENVTLFKHEEHSLDEVFACLIRLQIDDKQVVIFKHKYPIDVLSRSTVLRWGHTSKFSLEKEPLLKISDKIDFLLVDNTFIILNLPLLESKYGFNERYLKVASNSLDILRKKNILIDTKVFDELARKVSFSKKLMKIKSDNEVLKTPISEMKLFLENYKTKDGKFNLAQRIKYNPAKNKFEITTKIGAEDFLRLLNDQYLISLLTNKPYIVDAQTEFISEEPKVSEKTAKKKNRKQQLAVDNAPAT